MKRKRLITILLAFSIFVGFDCPKPTKASPQEIVQTTYSNAPAFGPAAPIIIGAGLLVAAGVGIYELVKIPHLPDTGNPNSRAIKYHPITKKPIQYRYYDEQGKTRLDIDLTDHGKPEYHPDVPHKHEYENGKRLPGRPMSKIEKEFYLGIEES